MTTDGLKKVERSATYSVSSDTDLSIVITALWGWVLSKGFTKPEATRIVTAASEIGRNIVKYASCGRLEYRSIYRHFKIGVEVSAIDQGPGIADVDAAMRDRFSTSGTLGLGLPGVKRLADEFELVSTPGLGTRATFRLWQR